MDASRCLGGPRIPPPTPSRTRNGSRADPGSRGGAPAPSAEDLESRTVKARRIWRRAVAVPPDPESAPRRWAAARNLWPEDRPFPPAVRWLPRTDGSGSLAACFAPLAARLAGYVPDQLVHVDPDGGRRRSWRIPPAARHRGAPRGEPQGPRPGQLGRALRFPYTLEDSRMTDGQAFRPPRGHRRIAGRGGHGTAGGGSGEPSERHFASAT